MELGGASPVQVDFEPSIERAHGHRKADISARARPEDREAMLAEIHGADSDVYYAVGSFSPLRRRALTATNRLEPDIERAAISGRNTSPNSGSKTPAAIGMAIAL